MHTSNAILKISHYGRSRVFYCLSRLLGCLELEFLRLRLTRVNLDALATVVVLLLGLSDGFISVNRLWIRHILD
jgi:hypothetical protein